MSISGGWAPTALPRRLLWGAILGLLAGLAVWMLGHLSLFAGYEAQTLDLRQKWFPAPAASTRQVAIVLIDEFSIETLKREEKLSYPWPHDLYVPMISFLKDAGAKAIIFDLLFFDRQQRQLDDDFAAGMRAAGNVHLAAKLDAIDSQPGGPPAALEKMRLSVAGWSHPLRPGLTGLALPFEEAAAAAAGLGIVNIAPDADGILRRADLLYSYPGTGGQIPSLALQALCAVSGPGRQGEVADGELHLAGRRIPLSADGRLLMRFYGPEGTIPTVNAVSLLRSYQAREEGKPLSVDPAVFRDRVVFIGINAAGREDIVPVPVSRRYPGTEFLATAAANLLGGDALREIGAAGRGGLLLGFGLAAGAALFALWRPLRVLAGALAIGAIHAAIAIAAFRKGIAVDVFLPALTLGSLFAASLIAGFLLEGRQKREVSRAFSQYLSPVVIREVLKNPQALKLGGESREITVFFSDVQGFSSFSEAMTPEELVSFLNVYLSAMTDIILARRGVIDKFEGDAIMAFWGAPAPLGEHAREACLAALDQCLALFELNRRFQAEGRPAVRFRAGLNTGPAVVGNMGSSQRFAYTAMGDTVNLASRLEGANKFFGTTVLISETVFQAAGPGILARRLGRIQVVGKKNAIAIYELLGINGSCSPVELERLQRYHEALERLEAGTPAGVEAAEPLFAAIQGADAPRRDPVVELCLQKCRQLKAAGAGWDGVWVMTAK